jgi:hypothetical protein
VSFVNDDQVSQCELTKAAVARRARAAKVMERNFMLRYDTLMSKKISLIYTHLLSVLSSFTMDVHNRHYLGFACTGVKNIAIIHFFIQSITVFGDRGCDLLQETNRLHLAYDRDKL